MQGLEEENIIIFQHDNDPKHIAHYILHWLLVQKNSSYLASTKIV